MTWRVIEEKQALSCVLVNITWGLIFVFWKVSKLGFGRALMIDRFAVREMQTFVRTIVRDCFWWSFISPHWVSIDCYALQGIEDILYSKLYIFQVKKWISEWDIGTQKIQNIYRALHETLIAAKQRYITAK